MYHWIWPKLIIFNKMKILPQKSLSSPLGPPTIFMLSYSKIALYIFTQPQKNFHLFHSVISQSRKKMENKEKLRKRRKIFFGFSLFIAFFCRFLMNFLSYSSCCSYHFSLMMINFSLYCV